MKNKNSNMVYEEQDLNPFVSEEDEIGEEEETEETEEKEKTDDDDEGLEE